MSRKVSLCCIRYREHKQIDFKGQRLMCQANVQIGTIGFSPWSLTITLIGLQYHPIVFDRIALWRQRIAENQGRAAALPRLSPDFSQLPSARRRQIACAGRSEHSRSALRQAFSEEC
jgi:hypothetical protein